MREFRFLKWRKKKVERECISDPLKTRLKSMIDGRSSGNDFLSFL